MNKLYKYALGLLTTFILTCCCFSSAEGIYNFTDTSFRYVYNNLNNTYTFDGVFCLFLNSNCSSNCGTISAGGQTVDLKGSWGGNGPFCTDVSPVTIAGVSSEYYNVVVGDTLLDTFNPQYTSLQCQTEYNLIPISEVTENYCKLNFNLINPAECPINEGTGAVNWSSLFINGTQYPGNASISVYIPEYIGYSVTYNDNENLIDIEGYNADESYIEGVINNEKLTPSNEDITLLFTGLVNFIPYLFIGLLIIRAVKIFNRIWR